MLVFVTPKRSEEHKVPYSYRTRANIVSENIFDSRVTDDIKTLQQKTVDKVHHVWEILKSSLDIEKDQARRLREQGADPEGGKPKVAGGETGGGGLEGAADKRFID